MRVIVFLVASSAAAMVVMAIGTAVLNGLLGFPSGERFYAFLWYFCHQFPMRSFWLFGNPFGLCARCIGGYSGIVIGSFIFVATAQNVSKCRMLFCGVALFALGLVDIFVKFYLGFDGSNWWRFLMGFFGGAGLSLIALLLVLTLFAESLLNTAKLRKTMHVFLGLLVGILLAPPAFAATVTIPSGTPVVVNTTGGYTSANAQPGQPVDLIVTSDVIVDGVVVIKAGALATGSIGELEEAEMLGQEGRLSISVNSVRAVDGTNVALSGTIQAKGDDETTGTVVGAIFCPLFLLNSGGEATIAQGTQSRAIVLGDVLVTPR